MSGPRRTSLIGNSLPRRCGIATFTTDLQQAVAATSSGIETSIIAMTDAGLKYGYPDTVSFEVRQGVTARITPSPPTTSTHTPSTRCPCSTSSASTAASGEHMLALLKDVRMPVVTTLHTVLAAPSPAQRRVMEEIVARSRALVVMADKGRTAARYLRCPGERSTSSRTASPTSPFVDSSFYKEQFGIEGRTVLLTFGLLSPNKGIETSSRPCRAIVGAIPTRSTCVLGATHPHSAARAGRSLSARAWSALAKTLGVGEHVIFHNRFVALDELLEFIAAADIYVTPYLNEAQITSGTLAYSFRAAARRSSRRPTGMPGAAGRRARQSWCRSATRRRPAMPLQPCLTTSRAGRPCAIAPTATAAR